MKKVVIEEAAIVGHIIHYSGKKSLIYDKQSIEFITKDNVNIKQFFNSRVKITIEIIDE